MSHASARRLLGLAVAVLFATLVAPAASAQTTLNVSAHDDGGEYWFEVEGMDGRNPTITLAPGESYTVNLVNEGEQVHNIHFGGGIDEATDIIGPGENATLEFSVPADASGEDFYWCDPHRGLGMEGPLAFGAGGNGGDGNGGDGNGGTPPTNGGDEAGGGIPGFEAVAALAAVGIAILAFRRRA